MSTLGENHKLTRSTTYAVLSLVLLCLIARGARCQAPDGDESFEFEHQDIGRISGLSSGTSQVAPQTTIVARQQQQQPPPPTSETAAHHHQQHHSASSSSSQSRHTQRHNASGSQRKLNRVTLVARRDPTDSLTAPVPVQTVAAPAAVAQLPAPPQQYSPQPQTVPSSSFELAQPTFAPQPPQEPADQQPAATSRPALNSLRATGSSVSSKHSALIAQVASERAAAASSISLHSEPALTQPGPSSFVSFGSAVPTQGLSSQHNQPAFASFASASAQTNPSPAAAPSFLLPSTASHHQSHQQLTSASSQPQSAVDQAEEPLVAPSFEHVLGHGCPHKGVFSWENKDHCDRYYMCTNGTFTEEACPNGLAYSQLGAVYQHCAYNWNVQCGNKKTAQPIASPGCPWQFGIFPIMQNGRCSIDYFVCEWGVPETKRCTPEGLFYDDRIKGCQWADQLGCKSEALLNFKCPPEDEDNPYWPYPRYYHSTQDVIVCVNEQPRLVHCNEDQLVDPGSLACLDVNKKKKKPF